MAQKKKTLLRYKKKSWSQPKILILKKRMPAEKFEMWKRKQPQPKPKPVKID
jgi:hypothetical protein